MKKIMRLLLENKAWAAGKTDFDPEYFTKMALGQSPEILWIGCSDSRVPPDEIINSEPGNLFVHRNIANLVYESDANLMSVMEYAILYLKVKYIIVCGHYNCGGVAAAFNGIDNERLRSWIDSVVDLKAKKDPQSVNELVEQNICNQVQNIRKLPLMQKLKDSDQCPQVIGWVYDLETGLLKLL